jgi:NADH-quinone oxidoreductase subunit J
MLTERVTGDDGRRVTARGWFWGLVAAVSVFVFLLLPAIQDADLPESAQSIQPSVKALGHKLMDPYVVTLEVLALLLTASLIGAVAAAQGVREKKEGTDDA